MYRTHESDACGKSMDAHVLGLKHVASLSAAAAVVNTRGLVEILLEEVANAMPHERRVHQHAVARSL